MSSREKFLIGLLAAIAILLGGYKLLIEPAYAGLSATKDAYTAILTEQQTAQNNIARAATIDEENSSLKDTIDAASAIFFPEFENDKIHLFFTELASDARITYSSFTMTSPVAAQISGTSGFGESITYPAKEAATGINALENGEPLPTATPAPTTDASAADNQLPKDMIEMMSVTLQYEGTYAQTLTFLTSINNCGRTARIASVNMLQNGQDGLLTVNITVDCFGVKKVTDDVLSDDTLSSPQGKTDPFLP